eukprot:Nk52_evm9s250 gene=Nk52_evmTU9s250
MGEAVKTLKGWEEEMLVEYLHFFADGVCGYGTCHGVERARVRALLSKEQKSSLKGVDSLLWRICVSVWEQGRRHVYSRGAEKRQETLEKLIRSVLGNVNTELCGNAVDSGLIDVLGEWIHVRYLDILEGIRNHISATRKSPRLVDFDWKVSLTLANDMVAEVYEPHLELELTSLTGQTGMDGNCLLGDARQQVCVDMNLQDLEALIEQMETARGEMF